MPGFSARSVGGGVQYYSTTDPTLASSPLLPLGTVVEASDGRAFKWCMVGASDLVAGNTIQSSAFLTNHTAMSVTASAIGVTALLVTPGATGGAANLYSEGYASISVTPGLGYTYRVSNHLAITSSVAFTLNLYPSDPIQIALTTSSKVDLIAHPYQNVIQMPVTTATGSYVGVAGYIIKASQNGWLTTAGPCAVLNKGTTGAGLPVGTPGSVAGGVVVFAVATTALVGTMMQTGVDASSNLVRLYPV